MPAIRSTIDDTERLNAIGGFIKDRLDPGLTETSISALMRGGAIATDVVGGMYTMIGMDKVGREIRASAEKLRETNQITESQAEKWKTFEMSDMKDWEWWSKHAGEQGPLLLMLMTQNVIASVVGQKVGGRAGAVAGGTIVSTLGESAAEAAMVHNAVLDETGDIDQADKAAADVFRNNVALLTTSNGAQTWLALSAFSRIPSNWLRRGAKLASAVFIGAGEELTQEVFSDAAERFGKGGDSVTTREILDGFDLTDPKKQELAITAMFMAGAQFIATGAAGRIVEDKPKGAGAAEIEAIIADLDEAFADPGTELDPELSDLARLQASLAPDEVPLTPEETMAAIEPTPEEPGTAEEEVPVKQAFEMTTDEFVREGPPPVQLPGRTEDELQLLDEVKNDTGDGNSKFVFHGTPSVEAARGIADDGLKSGGISAGPIFDYSESPDGMMAVFLREDFTEDQLFHSNGVSGSKDTKDNPVKPVGVFTQREFGGFIPPGHRQEEVGIEMEPPEFDHFFEVALALEEGKSVPDEVLAGIPASELDTARRHARELLAAGGRQPAFHIEATPEEAIEAPSEPSTAQPALGPALVSKIAQGALKRQIEATEAIEDTVDAPTPESAKEARKRKRIEKESLDRQVANHQITILKQEVKKRGIRTPSDAGQRTEFLGEIPLRYRSAKKTSSYPDQMIRSLSEEFPELIAEDADISELGALLRTTAQEIRENFVGMSEEGIDPAEAATAQPAPEPASATEDVTEPIETITEVDALDDLQQVAADIVVDPVTGKTLLEEIPLEDRGNPEAIRIAIEDAGFDAVAEINQPPTDRAGVSSEDFPTVDEIDNMEDIDELRALFSQMPPVADINRSPDKLALQRKKVAIANRISDRQVMFDKSEVAQREARLFARDELPDGEANPFEAGLPRGITATRSTAVNLMEVGRLLGVVIKSADLRGKMTGVFRLVKTTIELNDIRWTRTLSHEVGHASDFILNDGKFLSNLKARYPGLKISEKKAREELKRVAEFVRPLDKGQAWEKKTSHIKYRSQSDELVADLYSLMLLSPEDAARLAPNVTPEARAEITKNPNVKNALNSVNNSQDFTSDTVPQTERITNLPRPPEFVQTEPDAELRAEAFDLIKETNRSLSAALAATTNQTGKWREKFKRKEREDVSAFIEKTGNVNIEGDTFKDVKKRMTPNMRRLAKEARFQLELLRQEPNRIFKESGLGNERISYLVDYIPHFWVARSSKKAREFAGKWNKNAPALKKRKLPTLKEGVDLGFTPISTDIAFLVERTADLNFRAAYSTLMVKRLRDLRSVYNQPVIVASKSKAPSGWKKIEHPILRQVYARKASDGTLILGEGTAHVHPSIERPVKVLLGSKSDVGRAVNAINSFVKGANVLFSLFHEIALFESSQGLNAKFLNPLRGIFIGPIEQRRLGFTPTLGFLPKPTHRVGLELGRGDTFNAVDAAKHGLTDSRSASTDYARSFMEKSIQELETWVGQSPITRPASRWLIRPLRIGIGAYSTHLWDNVHAGVKLFSYNTMVAETLPNLPPGVTIKQAKETIASLINDAEGGQEFLELPSFKRGMTSPSEPATIKQTQLLHGVMFAPDWTFSAFRVAARPAAEAFKFVTPGMKANPVLLKQGLQYWRNIGMSLAAVTISMQRFIWEAFGGDDDPDMKKWSWQNELDHKWDIDITPLSRRIEAVLGQEISEKRTYIGFGKQVKEVIRYFEEFPKGLERNLGAKSSVVLRLAVEQGAGHQLGSGFPAPWVGSGYRRELEGAERIASRAKAAGEIVIPFSWQDNNFAFALPKSRGMTPYKAMKFYEQAMANYGDPGLWDKLVGANEETRRDAVIDIIKEVDAAAKANGLDQGKRKRLFNSARSVLVSEFTGKFWKDYENKKTTSAEGHAETLIRLGVTFDGMKQSARMRKLNEDLLSQGLTFFTNIPDEDLDSTLDYNTIFGLEEPPGVKKAPGVKKVPGVK